MMHFVKEEMKCEYLGIKDERAHFKFSDYPSTAYLHGNWKKYLQECVKENEDLICADKWLVENPKIFHRTFSYERLFSDLL